MMNEQEVERHHSGRPCNCVFQAKTFTQAERVQRKEVFSELSRLLLLWMEMPKRR
jgi:hypothetical protein